ncbi:TonB-dependent receptor domain-containing protein, partial [Hymenobacter glacialis]
MKQKVSATAVLLAALLGTSQLAAGQQTPGTRPTTAPAAVRATTGRITGTVTEAGTGKPVSYATVAVLDGAGKVVNGGVAGDDGTFILAGIPAGSYMVQVSFVGYKNEERPGTLVPAGGAVDLGKIILTTSAQKLGEVVVTGQKAIIEERVDRTVYNAENDQTTRGGDATDVLKRVPLLSVDLDGNVSLRGSSSIRVLINNKPSTIAAGSIADALKQIPADQIKTVEVITSPSAKYDAEGSGGIINIITKTNNLRGATLGINTSTGLRSSTLGLNGGLRTGKMGFSLGGYGRAQYNAPGEYSNLQTTRPLAGSTPFTTTQTADTRTQGVFGRYTLGWDYDINKFNSLQASVSYGTRSGRNFQDDLTTTTYAGEVATGTPLSFSRRDVATKDLSGTVDASLNYTHVFEKPQHEFSILTLFSRNDRTNTFTNNIFGATDDRASRIENNNPSYNEEYTAQFDYQNPLSKTQILEMGVKNILRRVNSDYSTTSFGANGEVISPQSGVGLVNNNQFNYRQNVTAAYTAYTLSLPQGFTIKPGLRYEYTVIDADFANSTVPVNIPDYGVLVPSVNLSRKLANANVMKLAYNKRIQRPSLQFLNPNVNSANPKDISRGNPTLAPEYTDNVELGYSTAYKGLNLNFSTFVRNTTGSIEALRTVRSDTVETTYANIGRQRAYGGSIFANISGPKVNFNAGIDTYYSTLTNNVSDIRFNASNEGWVASGRIGGSYNFTPVWGVQAFAFYRGRQVQLQGEQTGQGFYTLGIKRDFAEKRGSLGFGFDNFFTPNITVRTNVVSPLIDQNNRRVTQSMGFRVNLSYRIGKLTVAPPRRRRSINNDDLKSDGGGDAGGVGGADGGATGAPRLAAAGPVARA